MSEEEKQPAAYKLPSEVRVQIQAMEARMDCIHNTPLTAHKDLPALTDKQLDCINAFALRDEIRHLR